MLMGGQVEEAREASSADTFERYQKTFQKMGHATKYTQLDTRTGLQVRQHTREKSHAAVAGWQESLEQQPQDLWE